MSCNALVFVNFKSKEVYIVLYCSRLVIIYTRITSSKMVSIPADVKVCLVVLQHDVSMWEGRGNDYSPSPKNVRTQLKE